MQCFRVGYRGICHALYSLHAAEYAMVILASDWLYFSRHEIKYNTMQYNTLQCNTIQYNNNKTITDPKTIAEALNEHFASVGSTLAQAIPHVDKSYIAYLTRPQCTRFYINPTTTKEIEEEISKLNINKA